MARTSYDALGLGCRAKGELVTATEKKLTLRETSDNSGAAPLCTGAPATLTLTFEEMGVLAYKSDDEAGGSPSARLTKSGG
ncbi:hypothetical protein ABZW18_11145 [Streptomyces sp. NPDC004647]|uniref:hypothetical protein n=1 Tax=Streptomyces sp. NPDC004647 TaxID=3154671 RepID=UPI0033AECBC1